jgi:hypothetical protein
MNPRVQRILAAFIAITTRLAQGRAPRQLVWWAATALAIGWAATIAGWVFSGSMSTLWSLLGFVVVTVVFAAMAIACLGLAGSALASSAINTARAFQGGSYSYDSPRWVALFGTALIVATPASFILGTLISFAVAAS